MLRYLTIRHLAVIDRLELEFEPGLNVLTGETGAGKSILVGAVGLLVGGRASADLVRTGEDAAVVEAIFDAMDGRELIVRREISSQGRSRAWIDGALTTTTALRESCGGLVDLHGQHEHQVLLDPAAHLELLDEFAALSAERERVRSGFARWQQARTERDRLVAGEREKAARAEFLSFQLAEIERAGVQPGEDESLAATRQVLANADRLQRLCGEAYDSLYEGDQAALPALGQVWRRVGDLAALDARFAPYLDARDAVKSQLEDLAYFLRSYVNGIDASPARLQEVEDRLAVLERLKKKHGPTLDGVIETAAQLRRELHDIEHATERVAELDTELAALRTGFLEAASGLSAKRRAAAKDFCRALERSLADLAMARTRCEVRFEDAVDESGWTERGVERGEFYISPNPGEDLKPLARIASGGELSRVMLALRTLASTDAAGKTLIFDEVDAGIGAAVADVVGNRLQRLGGRFQVLCITHLPQIAAHGGTHYRIEKCVRAGRTVTQVARLGVDDRQEEIARMIGGADLSPSVRASAREMLASRAKAKGEETAKGESESPRRRK
ncbi:MAG: DNA repair protein RecN [Acidobacteria bacterium RIFCSPLOWO2_02_FULL_67_36]|nr:MAG: DNA repair protein RecN [Acidobacteria bacterium RIFCSPLOWO2_02_FULL_67_36]OFW18660.1 MAG: DNA repair protein RecN [Acidobacteria bacterium RIFCSPLOWO2_12_FULL_66_21]